MKRKLIALFVILAGLLLLTSVALAASPLKVTMELSQKEFAGPEEITVSIKISNISDQDLVAPVTLYYPDGTQIEEFGEPVLASGQQKSWSGTWTVTQDQLISQRITFQLRYSVLDDNQALVTRGLNFSKEIVYTGGVVSVEVNRTITPTTAGNGQKVSVTYEIVNTGTVEITGVTINEHSSISSKAGTIDSIPVGAKKSYTFTATMSKKDLTSQATITYTAGGKSNTVTKEKATIKYGEVNLKATLAADKKGGTAGETVTLTLTLKNSGKKAYNNIVVTDPLLGEVFTVDTIEAGKTVTLEKTITLNSNMDLQFTVTAESADGDSVETATDRMQLQVLSDDQLISLDVKATVESDVVYEFPSIVKFRVYVTNNSSSDVSNVSVAASGMVLYTFPTILAGETREFTRDVSIQMAGQYQFVASCRDQLNQTVTFDSNIVRISFSNPTPVPTEVPILAPAQPTYLTVPTTIDNKYKSQQMLLGNIGNACLLIGVIGLLLALAGIVIRVVKAAGHKNTIDSLEEASVRDYETEPEHREPEAEPAVERRDDVDPDPADLEKPSAAVEKEAAEEAKPEEEPKE